MFCSYIKTSLDNQEKRMLHQKLLCLIVPGDSRKQIASTSHKMHTILCVTALQKQRKGQSQEVCQRFQNWISKFCKNYDFAKTKWRRQIINLILNTYLYIQTTFYVFSYWNSFLSNFSLIKTEQRLSNNKKGNKEFYQLSFLFLSKKNW